MRKTRFIGLAPLVAVAAFAMTPMAAQAAKCLPFTAGAVPHYCANGTRLEEFPNNTTQKTPVIQWGKLVFGSGAGALSCKHALAGNVWNPEGGGAGRGETILDATYECTAACPLVNRVTAENLPWPSALFESGAPDPPGTVRSKITGIRLKVACYFPNPNPSNEGKKGLPAEAPFLFGGPGTPGEGELTPKAVLGSSGCNKPGTSVFSTGGAGNAGSGELEEEDGGEGRSSSPYPVKGAEPGTGTGEKTVVTGTVKTCGFNNSELINVES